MKSTICVGMLLSGMLLSIYSSGQGKSNHSFTQKENMSVLNQTAKEKEFISLVYLPLQYETADAQIVRPEWNILLDKWKADNTYVTSFVYPVKGYLVVGPEKTVQEGSLTAGKLKLISSLILKAADYEEALSLAKTFPVLKQGGTIEVREVQPR